MANGKVALKKVENLYKLKAKAALLDELLELIEERYFGALMELSEKEKNIPLSRAKAVLGA